MAVPLVVFGIGSHSMGVLLANDSSPARRIQSFNSRFVWEATYSIHDSIV